MKTRALSTVAFGAATLLLAVPMVDRAHSAPAQALPGWQAENVGACMLSPQYVSTESKVTLTGSGQGLTATQDAFTFLHQSWAGDGEFSARVVCVRGPRSGIAGLMFRGGMGTADAFFMAVLTAGGKLVVQSRSKAGDLARETGFSVISKDRQLGLDVMMFTTNNEVLASRVTPGKIWLGTNCWLKLLARGDSFSAYASGDGVTWFWLGTERIQMTHVQAGLVVAGSEFGVCTSGEFELIEADQPPSTSSGPAGAGTGDGLRAVYSSDSTGSRLERVDPSIDFHWIWSGPDLSIGTNLFRVRWEGMLEAQYSETYALTIVTDDGARLWLDDRLLIDQWNEQPAEAVTAEIGLVAGRKYSLRVDYFERYGAAEARLFWSSPSTPRQIIPQTQLYSHLDQTILADLDTNGIPDRWERSYGLTQEAIAELANKSIPDVKAYWAGMDPSLTNAGAPLPGGWRNRDIGNAAIPGASEVAGDRLLVSGSGDDIFDRNDSFGYTYQECEGDIQVVARVDSFSEDSHEWSKAGVMIREDLTDRSKNAFVAVTMRNGVTIQHRTAFAGTTEFRYWWGMQKPQWVKLIRRADTIYLYASRDGAGWEWLSTRNLPMESKIFVGLAVTSRDNSKLCAAEFSHVSISAPESLRDLDAASHQGDGLNATYRDLTTGAVMERKDPNIAFDWSSSAPAPGIHPEHFDATWEGKLEAPFSETYDLRIGVNDRARLWIDGNLVIDWDSTPDHVPANHDLYGRWIRTVLFTQIPLAGGQQYDFKLECRNEREGPRPVFLYWTSPSIPAQPIPPDAFYSADNPFYGDSPDIDHDGMPDAWERVYGLNPGNPADANLDTDGDGLTNLQECEGGSDPGTPDTNSDGIPDSWGLKYGLNISGPSIADADPDRDGLSNLQEYRLGTDPTKEDTDGDGLPDLIELTETVTDPIHGEIEGITTVLEVPGKGITSSLGLWASTNQALFALSKRGYVEYELKVPEANMYRLEIWGGMHESGPEHTQSGMAFPNVFPLVISIDGDYLDRKLLPLSGSACTFTPWLREGTHTLRVLWDNASRMHPSLEIASVKLVALTGKDKDGNGKSDWVDARLAAICGLETGMSNVVETVVSPFTLEGREKHLGTLRVSSAGATIGVQSGGNPKWYATIPLTPRRTTTAEALFENGALRQTARIDWVPLDMSRTRQITIRKGDSLLLNIAGDPKGVNDVGVIQLAVPGITNYSGTQPLAVRFDKPGLFVATGVRLDDPLRTIHMLQVEVVEWAFEGEVPAWTGKWRQWNFTNSFNGFQLQSGPGLDLECANAQGSQIKAKEAVSDRIVARLGESGPIVGSAPVAGFRLFSGSETEVYILEEFEDGSQLLEMGLVMSPLLPGVTVRLRVLAGGVLFDDGAFEKVLTATDFNELGQAAVRFIRPAQAVTSVCHETRAYQGTELLGIH